MGQLEESIVAYRKGIALQPDLPEFYNNLGNALQDTCRLDDAIASFRRAIALGPNIPEPYYNLGNVLKATGQLKEAIAAYQQSIFLRPDYLKAHNNLVYALHFDPSYDSHAIAQAQRRWNTKHAEPLRQFTQTHENQRIPGRRLRIGYVSPDFRSHVVGRNLLPLIRAHDRSRFEISCYSGVLHLDTVTDQFEQNADRWRNTTNLSDDQVAAQIREDQIDILVDLTLHMADNRLLVFARKPAPIQLTYLGYCSSTGMSAMDYRFSDPHFDPPDTDLSCYAEQTWRLPRSYWCYRPEAPTTEPTTTPARDNGFVTFGCLNNFAKVSTPALNLWAQILRAVAGSRIVIHSPPGLHQERVLQRFELGGVQRCRIDFVGKQPWDAYTGTYSRIDVALDSFPYGGGITTCDALWMGVPVVTLSGQTAVGRGGRSILSNLGLPELIAFTSDQYVQIAIELSGDLDRMDHLRGGLRARMLDSPLMNAEAFARDVEAAYLRMWRAWCAGVSIHDPGAAPSATWDGDPRL
jgi:predicted O-linked N-acetylglucosamine transferase (SPINDLY family)